MEHTSEVLRAGVEFNTHTSFYNHFFLLRTPMTMNGRPAVIKLVNGEPLMRFCGISVKLSAILQQAVAPVASKHGVYQVDNFYYEQVALFSMKFQSKSSLKQFLTDKEAVQEELSTVIASILKEEAKLSIQPQSIEQMNVLVNTKVYLVSPGIRCSPDVHEINLVNHSFMVDRWERSKLFSFTSTLFIKPPPSKYSDQTLVSTSQGDSSNLSVTTKHRTQETTNQLGSINNTLSNKRGVEDAEFADLQKELKVVIAWFELGVQLKIPTHDLLAIREDHRTVEKCRLEMLIKWEQLEKPTWTKLFSALVDIGMKGLADSLAKKYGLPQPFHAAVTPVKDSGFHKRMESEQKVSVTKAELTQAKQSQTLTSKKFDKKLSMEVPLLQHKVKSLTEETEFLKMQLKQRNEEMEMFEKMKQTAKQDELDLLDRLVKEKNEQIRSLEGELIQKKNELDATKKQLRDKEIELVRIMEELNAKSAQVSKLETKVEEWRQSFNEQQEEMNKKLIEASAANVSHERYLKEVETQRDIALEEASKTKDEIQVYSQKLMDKEKEISDLSKKITEQKKDMAKLQEELASHCNLEQLSAEQTREDNKKEEQLLTLMTTVMKLQLELHETKTKKNQDKMNLEEAKKTMKKYEKLLEIQGDTEGQSSVNESATQVKRKEKTVEKYEKLLEVQGGTQGQRSADKSTAQVKKKENTLSVDHSDIKLSCRAVRSAPYSISRSVDATVDGDIVYIRPYNTQHVLAYDSTNDTWCKLPDTPTKCCSIAVINGVLTTVGGELNGQPTNQLFNLIEGSDGHDRKKWVETLSPMPNKEAYTITVCCGTHLIVTSMYSSTVIQIMDTRSLKWSLVAHRPFQSDHRLDNLIVCGEYLYLVYMSNNRVFRCSTTDLIHSTPKENRIWSELEQTEILRRSTYVAIHGHLMSFGGCDLGLKAITDVRMYSPTTKTWKVIGQMKTPKRDSLVAVLSNNRLLVAGGYTTSPVVSTTNEAEIVIIAWPKV